MKRYSLQNSILHVLALFSTSFVTWKICFTIYFRKNIFNTTKIITIRKQLAVFWKANMSKNGSDWEKFLPFYCLLGKTTLDIFTAFAVKLSSKMWNILLRNCLEKSISCQLNSCLNRWTPAFFQYMFNTTN